MMGGGWKWIRVMDRHDLGIVGGGLERGIVSLQFPKIVDMVPSLISNAKEDRSDISQPSSRSSFGGEHIPIFSQ